METNPSVNNSTREMLEFELKAHWDDLADDEVLSLFRQSNIAIAEAITERGEAALKDPVIEGWMEASDDLWRRLPAK